jgi:hypothetical protein
VRPGLVGPGGGRGCGGMDPTAVQQSKKVQEDLAAWQRLSQNPPIRV